MATRADVVPRPKFRFSVAFQPVINALKAVFLPFRHIPLRAYWILCIGWLALFIFLWYHNPWKAIPKPQEIFAAEIRLLQSGLLTHMWESVKTFGLAFVWSSVFSLMLGYGYKMNVLRPAGWLISKLRFLGMVGLQFVFTVIFGSGENLKIAIIAWVMTLFLTPGIIKIIRSIPQEDYDHACTLRMNDWQVLWYVVIRGTADKVWDAIQINNAMGFVMLVAMEAIVQSLGGAGSLLARRDKYMLLSDVFAIQWTILFTGILLDYITAVVRSGLCPYAELVTRERR